MSSLLTQFLELLPSSRELWDVLTLQNYNTRLVVMSTTLLGIASGIVGSFLLLRKRSLMGDALSHAALPGIALAFILMTLLGGDGKSLAGLITGAAIAGGLGVLTVIAIRSTTRLKDDAAMGIVLSVFYGFGVVLLHSIQNMPGAQAAGLESFIEGHTASMIFSDFLVISGVTITVTIASLLLLKEFTALCFDEQFAGSQGWPTQRLDLLLLGLVTAVTVAGLQAVGLILIIAFLITPAAAARFWTDDLRYMLILSGIIGGISGWLGAAFSALMAEFPAGAVIILFTTGIFAVSFIAGSQRGIIKRWLNHRALLKRVGRQHFLRAAYEIIENNSLKSGQVADKNKNSKIVRYSAIIRLVLNNYSTTGAGNHARLNTSYAKLPTKIISKTRPTKRSNSRNPVSVKQRAPHGTIVSGNSI